MKLRKKIFYFYSLCSRAPSPRCGGGGGGTSRDDQTTDQLKTVDTPGSLSPSSDEQALTRTNSQQSRQQSQPSRSGMYTK